MDKGEKAMIAIRIAITKAFILKNIVFYMANASPIPFLFIANTLNTDTDIEVV
jgi:hypothetical protein